MGRGLGVCKQTGLMAGKGHSAMLVSKTRRRM